VEERTTATVEKSALEARFDLLKKVFSLIFIVLVLGISIFLATRYSLEEIKQFMQANPQWIFLLSMGVYVVWSMTLIPSFPLTAFLALTVGPLQASILGTLGMTLAGLLEYLMGAQMSRVIDIEKLWLKLPKRLREMPIDSPLFLILGRMVPVGPKLVSTIAGARKVNLWRFLWTTVLLSLVGAVIPAYAAVGVFKI
jgi:uncharacterized membrane protein YdjX (TVP38/TMEM64 family)